MAYSNGYFKVWDSTSRCSIAIVERMEKVRCKYFSVAYIFFVSIRDIQMDGVADNIK